MGVQSANAYSQGAGFLFLCPFTGSGKYSGAHYHRSYNLAGHMHPPCQNQFSGNIAVLTLIKGDLPAAMKTALATYQINE